MITSGSRDAYASTLAWSLFRSDAIWNIQLSIILSEHYSPFSKKTYRVLYRVPRYLSLSHDTNDRFAVQVCIIHAWSERPSPRNKPYLFDNDVISHNIKYICTEYTTEPNLIPEEKCPPPPTKYSFFSSCRDMGLASWTAQVGVNISWYGLECSTASIRGNERGGPRTGYVCFQSVRLY